MSLRSLREDGDTGQLRWQFKPRRNDAVVLGPQKFGRAVNVWMRKSLDEQFCYGKGRMQQFVHELQNYSGTSETLRPDGQGYIPQAVSLLRRSAAGRGS